MTGFEYTGPGSVYLNDISDPFNIFQGIIYNKGAYVLHMLRGVLGDTIFFNSIKNYSSSSQFKYKHATTENFQDVCEANSNLNLDFFFDQWIYDENYPKYQYNWKQDTTTLVTSLVIFQAQQSTDNWRPVFEMPLQIFFSFANDNDSIITVHNNQQFQTYFFNFNDTVANIFIDTNNWVLKSVAFSDSIYLGTKEEIFNKPNVKVIPNPNNGAFSIILPNTNTGEVYISLMDLTGRIVYSKKLMEANPKINIQNTKYLSEGLYILNVKTKKNNFVEKVIIRK